MAVKQRMPYHSTVHEFELNPTGQGDCSICGLMEWSSAKEPDNNRILRVHYRWIQDYEDL